MQRSISHRQLMRRRQRHNTMLAGALTFTLATILGSFFGIWLAAILAIVTS